MKRINILYLAAVAALTGCSSDDFLGTQITEVQPLEEEISFGSKTTNVTRATPAATDHDKLGNQFNVYGVKSLTAGDPAVTTYKQVFNDYGLWYIQGSQSASNQKGWEYVHNVNDAAVTPNAAGNELGADIVRQQITKDQTIKYWDFSANDYWFYAISAANDKTSEPAVETYTWKVGTADAVSGGEGKVTSCVIEGVSEDNSVYYADAVQHVKKNNGQGTNIFAQNTVPNQADASSTNPEIVTFTFKRLQSKVRIGFYETVPGYAINDVKFYYETAENKLSKDGKVNFLTTSAPSATPLTKGFQPAKTDYTITYDYNYAIPGKAKLTSKETQFSSGKTFGNLNYAVARDLDADSQNEYYMGESANSPTWAVASDVVSHTESVSAHSPYTGSTKGHYWYVLPNETQYAQFKVKVDYTLTALDDSKETIHVTGAEAVVPEKYCHWMGNTAYTYIFKISDNTNGTTGTPDDPDDPSHPSDPAGLYPITFDACVEDVLENTEETITEVATPSITTYAVGSDVTGNNEYAVGNVIVLSAEGATASKWELCSHTGALTEQEAKLLDETNKLTWQAVTDAKFTVIEAMKGKWVIVRMTYDTNKHAYKVIKIKA